MTMSVSSKPQVSFGTNIIIPPEVRSPLSKKSKAVIDQFVEAKKSDGINTTLEIKKLPRGSYSDIMGEYQVITDGKHRGRSAFPQMPGISLELNKIDLGCAYSDVSHGYPTVYQQIKETYQDMKNGIAKVNKRNQELLKERKKH